MKALDIETFGDYNVSAAPNDTIEESIASQETIVGDDVPEPADEQILEVEA